MSYFEKLKERLLRLKDPKHLAICIITVLGLSAISSYFLHYPFWKAFLIVFSIMSVTGLLFDNKDY